MVTTENKPFKAHPQSYMAWGKTETEAMALREAWARKKGPCSFAVLDADGFDHGDHRDCECLATGEVYLRDALLRDCPRCDGVGGFPGRLPIDPPQSCSDSPYGCDSTGKIVVWDDGMLLDMGMDLGQVEARRLSDGNVEVEIVKADPAAALRRGEPMGKCLSVGEGSGFTWAMVEALMASQP